MDEPLRFPGAERPSWHALAACLHLGVGVFYRELGESRGVWGERSELARTACRACPVRPVCDVTAVANREPEGIWAGYEHPGRWQRLGHPQAGAAGSACALPVRAR